jgi:2-methylaconitate cis-trans-isomerase PrpF
MVGLVAPPEGYRTLSGGKIKEKQMDLRVRLLFMNRLHESIAWSGAICLAAATQIPGWTGPKMNLSGASASASG